MDWLILALGAAILPMVPNLADKYIILNKDYGIKALSVVSIFFYILFAFIAAFQFMEGMSLEMLLVSLTIGFIFGVVTYLIFKAFMTEQVTVVTTIYNIFPIFVAIGAAIFLSESIGAPAIVGVVLTVIGVMLVSISSSGGTLKIGKGIVFVVSGMLLAAVAQLLTKYVLNSVSFWDYLFVGAVGHALFMGWFLLEKDVRGNIFRMVKDTKTLGIVAVKEGVWVISAAMFLAAASVQKITIISTIASTTPVFIFIGAVLIGKFMPGKSDEKIDAKTVFMKAVSIALVVSGVMLVSFF